MDPMMAHDPFTSTWTFNSGRSTLSTPLPRSWVQEICASDEELRVEERITNQSGVESVVRIGARFDGRDYSVTGSPVADTFAYEREGLRIIGIGRKSGGVSIRETVVVSGESVMTLSYSIFVDDREVASGIAIFEKSMG